MKIFGKTIKMFLLDGVPNGRIVAELSNWTGKCYRIPRTRVRDSINRQDLQSTGIYMLFGNSDLHGEKRNVYIGEAENIIKRLQTHLNEKDFWNEVVVFISKDENLNKAHIKYIENRLHQIANEVSRFDIINANIPNLPSISEPDQAEMEEFIENIKMIVNILGFKLFENLRQENINEKNFEDNSLYINAARGAEAQGKQVADGFLVLKNSKVATSMAPSFPPNYKLLRDELIKESVLKEEGGVIVFSKDYLFSSPSSAAAIVMGRSANGLREWKDKSGRDLKSKEQE